MEKITLSRGNYNRIDKGVNLALELENRATSPRAISPPQQAISQRLAKLTGETTTTNGGLTWQAEEVYLDATGAVVTKPNGYEWTDDNPVFTLNAATQDAVLLVSQSGRPAVNPDPAKRYWFGNPGGGGGGASVFYCIFKSNNGNNLYTCDVYPDALYTQNTAIKINAIVRVFNVDYGEVLNDTKLTCFEAPSTDIGVDYYAEAPTWQQEV